MQHVLIAPDKFKGSLTAVEVAEAIAEGIRTVAGEVPMRLVPVADGGDGTVAAALAQGYRPVPAKVTGPVGEPVDAELAVHGSTAVLELASASGLALMNDLAPMTASSRGTGELIRIALDTGARTIVLGVGGSACSDGGAGMLAALGAELVDVAGNPLPDGGGALADIAEVDLSGTDSRLSEVDIVLASDVDNPLLGPTGAAHVYGAQKGADPEQLALLDAALSRWARALIAAGGRSVAEEPGSGAAGGVGFGAMAALSARRRAGTDLLLELVDFDRQLTDARLVITGEGMLDEQTLRGKAPQGVAARASAAGIPVVAIAGDCVLPEPRLHDAGFGAGYALTDIEPDVTRCIEQAPTLLGVLGERLARDWLVTPR